MYKITKLNELLQASPDDCFLNHALALEFIKIGEDQKAKLLFEELLNREPGYIGSYYHLAKLLERIGDEEGAIKVYNKGMEKSTKAGDKHAYGELRGALEELTF